MSVTKDELLRVVMWERKLHQKLRDQHNALRDACVKVGLTLSWTEPPTAKSTECLLILSKALRAPANDTSSATASAAGVERKGTQ